jgi:D-alanyl-D-alanine carboxypeptidase/D-alanyl-D-alanine-endopeptidase (penicillin-binding protein 4)
MAVRGAGPVHHERDCGRFQAERPMQPGSTMKLVTTIVALDRLGPNHRGTPNCAAPRRWWRHACKATWCSRAAPTPNWACRSSGRCCWTCARPACAHRRRPAGGPQPVPPRAHRPGPAALRRGPGVSYNVIPDALLLAGNLLPLEIKATADGVRGQRGATAAGAGDQQPHDAERRQVQRLGRRLEARHHVSITLGRAARRSS